MKPHYQPPALDIVGPTGQRVTITAHSALDTVGDLARSLGLTEHETIAIDGQAASRHEPLIGSGLRAASVVTARPGDPDQINGESLDRHSRDVVVSVEAIVVGGPDCSTAIALPIGRHVLGRAPAARLRIDDPQLELHHGVLDVSAESAVTFTQLTGRIPALLNGVSFDGTVAMPLGSELVVGASRIRFRATTVGVAQTHEPAGGIATTPADPWRRVVRRGPFQLFERNDRPIVVPDEAAKHPAPPATGLVGAGIAVIGAGGVALLLGQMMFALFAIIGAVASIGTWALGAVSAWRRRRRALVESRAAERSFVDDLDDAHDRAAAFNAETNPVLESALLTTTNLADPAATHSNVWHSRVVDDVYGLSAVLGRGSVRWTPPIDMPAGRDIPHDLSLAIERAATLHDAPVSLTFGSAETVGIRGDADQVGALVRSLIVQLATRYGPADWQIVVVSQEPDLWRWVEWLPHARTRCGNRLVLNAANAEAMATGLESVRSVAGRPVVLVVDDCALFSTRTGVLRRFVETTSPSTIALIDGAATVPALCRRVLTVGSTGTASWSGERSEIDDATNIRVSGVSVGTAEAAARSLAAMIDPEDSHDVEASLASSLSLTDIDDTSASPAGQGVGGEPGRRAAARAIARRWEAGGSNPEPRAPIGRSADGLVEVDLVRDGPHGLIAGTTGSGKSELLRTMVVSLASQLSPDHLTFVLIDYKGGATFDACAQLPHTVGVVTDLDAGLAERALVSLEAELHRRERLLRVVGASDLADYRSNPDAAVLPRLVVVIDEFAALAKELPDFLTALVGIAQRGRSLGVHLILATQRPAGVVTDDIRANTNLRIALRLNDVADAHDVVGDDKPAAFGRNFPGRAALRLGPDELVVFQAACCTGAATHQSGRLRAQSSDADRNSAHIAIVDDGCDDVDAECEAANGSGFGADAGRGRHPSANAEASPMSELEVAVALIGDAAAVAGIQQPHRPWIEPLPTELGHDEFSSAIGEDTEDASGDAVGLVDVPEEQSRQLLRWDRSAGNLALVGSLGSGTTSTLISLVAAQCSVLPPEKLHCYVIDGRGDARLDGLASIAHCGGVVRLGEAERLHRLLAALVDNIDQRASRSEVDEPVGLLLAIDGLGSLRTALSSIDLAPTLALLDRVLNDGPAVGVAVCWAVDGSSMSAAARTAAETWIFHLDDPDMARSLGLAGVAPPADIPGRLRIVSSGREAQVAVGAAGLASLPDRSAGGGPATIEVLPERVCATTLVDTAERCSALQAESVTAARDGLASYELPIGLSSDDLEVAMLHVPTMDHIFIGGAALTGKSTALAQVSVSWQRANSDGVVLTVDRHTPLTEARLAECSHLPTLVVVDDAERVEDTGGGLASILASGRPGVTIVAAARLDAVRASYGHWTREVARSRCGLILTSAGDVDGDLLGATLPRRSLIAPRPGLAWLVDSRGHRLIQVAS